MRTTTKATTTIAAVAATTAAITEHDSDDQGAGVTLAPVVARAAAKVLGAPFRGYRQSARTLRRNWPSLRRAFVALIPAPLGIGTIALADGTSVKGFLCESHAVRGAEDITSFGGWRAWLASRQG